MFLALLTPGIPEYLSGSSPFSNLVLDPGWFALGLALNLGLYVPGALLVREASVRWGKGWATVLTLGAAYALVEEGLALSTMFDPTSSAAGPAGAYGHALGVNWVWVPEIMLVHMIFSIALPILLFGLVFPELRGRPMLSRPAIGATLGILALDVTVLAVVVHALTRFWMGDAVLVGALLAVAALTLLAYRMPRELVRSVPGPTRPGAFALGCVGAAFFVGLLILVSVLESARLPMPVVVLAIPAYAGGYLVWIERNLGNPARVRGVLAFALGLITPIMAIGLISQARLPIVLVADLLVVLFFRYLWRRFPERERTGVTAPFASA